MGLLTNPFFQIGMGLVGRSGPSLTPVNPWLGVNEGLMSVQRGRLYEQEAQQTQLQMEQMKREAVQQERLQQWAAGQSDPMTQMFPELAAKAEFERRMNPGETKTATMSTAGQLGIQGVPPETPVEVQMVNGVPVDYNIVQPKGGSKTPAQMQTAGAPTGYQWKDPNNPAAGVTPLGGYVPSTPADDTGFKRADTLRDEYQKQSAEFITTRDAYAKILSADASPAGDMSLVFGYMKMLDPGSSVREGEYATAENAASVPERIRTQYNKALTGEKLGEAQRQDFRKQAGGVYEAQLRGQKALMGQYTDLAKRYGTDPGGVVFDYDAAVRGLIEQGVAPPDAEAAAAEAAKEANPGIDDLLKKYPGLK